MARYFNDFETNWALGRLGSPEVSLASGDAPSGSITVDGEFYNPAIEAIVCTDMPTLTEADLPIDINTMMCSDSEDPNHGWGLVCYDINTFNWLVIAFHYGAAKTLNVNVMTGAADARGHPWTLPANTWRNVRLRIEANNRVKAKSWPIYSKEPGYWMVDMALSPSIPSGWEMWPMFTSFNYSGTRHLYVNHISIATKGDEPIMPHNFIKRFPAFFAADEDVLWREIDPYYKDSGVWKPIQQGWYKYGGDWLGIYKRVPELGTAMEGGYFGGQIILDGTLYNLIVAPKSGGENSSLRWKTSNTADGVAASWEDGWANTVALNNSAHPAAQWCRSLSIGGYSDWYLPSPFELELLYHNLKPTTSANYVDAGYNLISEPPRYHYGGTNWPTQTTVNAFKSGGAQAFEVADYWSSREVTNETGSYTSFQTGQYMQDGKSQYKRVRAVRKVPA